MTTYLLLIPDVEEDWAATTEDQRQAVYARHRQFSEALAARGHTVVHAAQLAPPSQARVVRRVDGQVRVTEGPYAEAAEQLSGYYLIDSHDVDDLLQVVAILADAEPGLELRECLGDDGPHDGPDEEARG